MDAQYGDAGCLRNMYERLIRRRKDCPELGWGSFRPLDTGEAAVFAHRSDWEGGTIVAVHHLGDEPVSIRFALNDAKEIDVLVDLFADHELKPDPSGRVSLDLEPYGHRWLRARRVEPG